MTVRQRRVRFASIRGERNTDYRCAVFQLGRFQGDCGREHHAFSNLNEIITRTYLSPWTIFY